MHRFYVETSIAEAGVTVTLSAEESAHAARVLRLRPGEEVRLLDDENLWEAVLESVDPKETTAKVTAQCPSPEAPAQAVLFQGLPKADKLELIAQKGTELGMWELWPVEMERSVAKADKADKADKKRERLSRIALEAAKQSGRARVPEIASTISFHLRMRPVSRRHSRRGLVGASTLRSTPISRSLFHASPRQQKHQKMLLLW